MKLITQMLKRADAYDPEVEAKDGASTKDSDKG